MASLNRPDDALEVIDKVDYKSLDKTELGVFSATKGLIEFRKGNAEKGRKLYSEAINSFEKEKYYKGIAMAKYFWGKEEKLIGSDTAQAIIGEAVISTEKYKVNEIKYLVKQL